MIAIDAMGGDNAPHAPVLGALRAARAGIRVGLFGNAALLVTELQMCDPQWSKLPIEVVHCADTIGMADMPTRSVLKQRDSSLVRALRAVVEGQATAVVSAGNSGAALVAGVLHFDCVPGIERPALGRSLPSKRGTIFCLDLGVNADCKPEYLVQFALMGQAYARIHSGIATPRIGLLSNGHEPYKGSTLVKKSYELLSQLPINFVGNVEARDIFDDHADVVVSDGFSGNILLKTAQGTAKAIAYWIEQEAASSWTRSLCMRLFGHRLMTKLSSKTDYANQAGALLLGLKYPLVVVHGCATAEAVERSVTDISALVSCGFLQEFNQELVRLLSLVKMDTASIVLRSSTAEARQTTHSS